MTAAVAPFSIEAEQALLGALLIGDGANHGATLGLRPDHFHDPVHARIYAAIAGAIEAGKTADASMMGVVLRCDVGLAELGGSRYLVRLANAAIGASSAPDYARAIIDLAHRRRMIDAAENLAAAARAPDAPINAALDAIEAERAEQERAGDARPKMRAAFDVAVGDVLEGMAAAYQADTPPGARSGLAAIDRLVGDFRAGRHYVLGGRPGMGKSALASALAWRIAEGGWPVCFATVEMEPGEVVARVLSEIAAERLNHRITHERIGRGEVSEHEFQAVMDAAEMMTAWSLDIFDVSSPKVDALCAEIRRWARRAKEIGGPPVVFLDYLQLVSGSDRRANRTQEVGEVSRKMKMLARETGACVVSLAQLSRQVEQREDKRPQLSDLRDSGEIEQDADVVIFAYREEYYLEREKPSAGDSEAVNAHFARLDAARGRIAILCRKRRQGPTGEAVLRADLGVNRIWEDEP